MNCQRCGKKLNPKSKFCDNCGTPVNMYNNQSKSTYAKQNIKPIKNKDKSISRLTVVQIVLWCVLGALVLLSGTIFVLREFAPSENVTTSPKDQEEFRWSLYYEKNKDSYTEVDVTTLHNKQEEFIGKKILTVVRIGNKDDYSFKISLASSDSIFYDIKFSFKEYDDTLKYYNTGDYVTVIGTVESGGIIDINVKDCRIIESGIEAKERAEKLNNE